MLEGLDQRLQTATLVTGMSRAAGAEVEMPDWDKVRADFDAHLAAEPERLSAEDNDTLTMLQALGLR